MPWALWPPQSICRIESLERAGDGPSGTNDSSIAGPVPTATYREPAVCQAPPDPLCLDVLPLQQLRLALLLSLHSR